jgi:hypothetical protein
MDLQGQCRVGEYIQLNSGNGWHTLELGQS